jgi:hypothetical protein
MTHISPAGISCAIRRSGTLPARVEEHVIADVVQRSGDEEQRDERVEQVRPLQVPAAREEVELQRLDADDRVAQDAELVRAHLRPRQMQQPRVEGQHRRDEDDGSGSGGEDVHSVAIIAPARADANGQGRRRPKPACGRSTAPAPPTSPTSPTADIADTEGTPDIADIADRRHRRHTLMCRRYISGGQTPWLKLQSICLSACERLICFKHQSTKHTYISVYCERPRVSD